MARMRIKDIAEAAGVSPATVSRYLNNRPGQMTDQTRERIAKVIEETGYRPRAAARNLRSAQSSQIGVVLADISNPYSSAMLEALSDEAGQRGYSLTCSISGNDPAKERAALERLVQTDVDGIVVNTCGGTDDAIAAAAGNVPLVLLDRDVCSDGYDLVTSDNARLMDDLLGELLCHERRPKRCVLFTEKDATSPVRRAREEAFARELAERGMPSSVVVLPDSDDEAGRVLEALLAGSEGAGAVGTGRSGTDCEKPYAGEIGLVCVNGLVLLRLVEALARLTPALPDGVGVATFDDYSWNRVLFGGITSAAQDTSAIARAVVERLLERIDASLNRMGGDAGLDPVRIEVPGHVIVRASTRY